MFCPNCGKQLPDGVRFCTGCGTPLADEPVREHYAPAAAQPAPAPAPEPPAPPVEPRAARRAQPKEHVFRGFLGALLGSLAGVAVMIILAQLGYVAALSGVVMAVCTLLGYQRFGRRLSGLGIFISILVIIVMVLVGMAINSGVSVLRLGGSWDDFFETVKHYIPSIIDMLSGKSLIPDSIRDLFLEELGMQYGFAALGAVPTIIASVRSRKK